MNINAESFVDEMSFCRKKFKTGSVEEFYFQFFIVYSKAKTDKFKTKSCTLW